MHRNKSYLNLAPFSFHSAFIKNEYKVFMHINTYLVQRLKNILVELFSKGEIDRIDEIE